LVDSEVQRQSLIKELKSLQDLKIASQQRNNLIPQLQQKYQDLLRKTEVAQTAYKNLLLNLQQVQIIENQNVGNAQVVSEAVVSQYPVSTSRKLIVAAGISVGSVLYVITAFLLELKDSSFKTTKELRQSFDYKLLTTIPNLEKKNLLGRNLPMAILPELQTTDAPNSLVSEAYRMLYTNLQFQDIGRDLKVVTITSSIPREGKSTVSANFASAIAQLGQKVLLIDADVRKPRQHSIWQLKNQIGLIEVLQGKADLWQTIQPSLLNFRMDVLTAGSNLTNYLSLLKSERMNELIALCREKYDLVILDTPPVSLFSDTLTISKNTDGIVLVGRLGVNNPETARNAKELLEQSEQRILGLVVNGVDNEPKNYYKYAKYYEQEVELKQKLLSPFSNK
jgi:capsular exopolysaccharide synthesis family protein